jgi:ABC-type glycerol-3-phosphate transport system substrate-binding protein
LRGGTWNINAKSPQPQSSWEFIKHITNRENMLRMNTEGGEGALTRPDIMNDPYFTQNENFQVYLENLLTALPAIVPANFRGFEYEDTFSQNHAELYLGKIGFDEGLKKMNDAVQRVLEKPAD